jgi:chemotaxis protein MotB
VERDQNKKTIVFVAGLILVAIASLGGYLYNSQLNKFNALADESQSAQQGLKDELSQGKKEIDQLNNTIAQLTQERTALQESQSEVQDRLAAEQASRQQMKAELETARAEKEQAVLELEDRLAEEQASRQQMKAELETARAEKEQAVLELEDRLAEEQASRQQMKAELEAELETARAEKEQAVLELQAQLQGLATASSNLETNLRRQMEEQKALDARIDTVSNEKDQLLVELVSEQERALQLQQQIARVSEEADQKEIALSDKEQAVSELNLQLDQSREQQDLLIGRIEAINRQRERDSQQFAELERRLKQELDESRFEISQLKNRMTVIKLTSEVLFNSGSARIKPAGQEVLSLIAESLNNYPDRAINVEGHTDNVPIGKNLPYASNWELSTARALAAVDFFQKNEQIKPDRLKVVGYGEYRPIATNETAAGRYKNRRIEIKLLPEN